ncbi:olfactory receptor 7A10-like [Dasypus novemcinctus]|uniref:olfactory receptor 7A10-like n=1 Tax=Dasypus novemcinctus TaxID=9361 RepID=UPI0039C9B0F5
MSEPGEHQGSKAGPRRRQGRRGFGLLLGSRESDQRIVWKQQQERQGLDLSLSLNPGLQATQLDGGEDTASISLTNHPGRNLDFCRKTLPTPSSLINHMGPGNKTQISDFFLLGFSEDPEVQSLLFWLFLSMYLVTIFGNLLIILVIITDSHLHTPMYFFLSNLSLCDICLSSTTVPKMLVNIQAQSSVITYTGCVTQMYFFMIFAGLDDFLLAVTAYDRFVAICHPLHYTAIMNPQICVLMILGSWVMTFIQSCLEEVMVLRLSFCTHAEIPHFFCELRQMVQLACSDTFFNYLAMYLIAGVMGGGPLCWILFSYSKIVSSIHAISSAQGKYKAFSTCASHLSVVSLFYCTSIGVYLSSAASHNTHSGASASVMYTVITPMLNPFIYSLRNKDIRGALNKCFGGTLSFCTNVEVLPEVLKIASSDILLNNLLVYFVAIVSGIPPVIGILFSYSKTVSSILRISSAGVKYKAFSTCGCHLSVDSLFYGTGTGVYLSFETIPSSRKNLVASVICALVTPMLNPSSTARGAGI